MDIELKLRDMLVLRDPGPHFTDSVLARLCDAPQSPAGEGVASLADARRSRRGRYLLGGAVVVVAAAAAMIPFLPDGFRFKAAAQAATMVSPGEDDSGLSEDDASIAVAAAPLPTSPVDSAGPTGADPLQCLDEDVLQGLLVAPEITYSLHDDVPALLADLRLPRELAWLGSPKFEARGSGMAPAYAVYRTSLELATARQVARDALTAAGWEYIAPVVMRATAFVSASSLASSTSDAFCREGKPLGLGGGTLGGVNYLVLSVDGPGQCNLPPPGSLVRAGPVDEFIPTLQLPPDPQTGLPAAVRGQGTAAIAAGSQSQASFTASTTIDAVADHFAGQMAAQGWRPDARWTGTATAGSTWSRQAPDGKNVLATLDIHAYEAGRFNAMLRVMLANEG